MLIHRLVASSNCWRIDYGKQKRKGSIDENAQISTDAVIKELKKSSSVWRNYSKSSFTDTQKTFLKTNTNIAIVRAKALREYKNPSTSIYKLIDVLKEPKRLDKIKD